MTTEPVFSTDLLKAAEAAQYLRVTESTLSHWRWSKRGPAYERIGGGTRGNIRYRLSELQRFVAAGPGGQHAEKTADEGRVDGPAAARADTGPAPAAAEPVWTPADIVSADAADAAGGG